MKINTEELKDIINDVKVAVDNSTFGPLFVYTDDLDPMNKQCNQLAWTLYLHLISPIMQAYVNDMRPIIPDKA